jgi:hypothetical protein
MRLSPLSVLFDPLGIRSHVLVETFHPFAPDGESESLVFRTAHMRPPSA